MIHSPHKPFGFLLTQSLPRFRGLIPRTNLSDSGSDRRFPTSLNRVPAQTFQVPPHPELFPSSHDPFPTQTVRIPAHSEPSPVQGTHSPHKPFGFRFRQTLPHFTEPSPRTNLSGSASPRALPQFT